MTIKHSFEFIRYSFKPVDWLRIFAWSAAFFIFIGLLPNWRIILGSLFAGEFALLVSIVPALILGVFTATNSMSTALLSVISFLTVLNIMIIRQKTFRAREAGMTGFASLLGIFISGCASCATGLLPVLGVTTAVAFLPFKGYELAWLSIILLVAVTYTNTHQVGKIKRKK